MMIKNNLSKKSPRKKKNNSAPSSRPRSLEMIPGAEVSGSDNGVDSNNDNSCNTTLSRNSWARSSDAHRGSGSLAMEFTVLGFDDSSLDGHRLKSDTSSFACRSVSPDVNKMSAGFFSDVQSRLRYEL